MAFAAFIGPAIQGGLAVGQMAFGASQSRKAKAELESLERPEYEIPEEILQNLSAAERMALEGLPAQERQLFLEDIQRAIATGGSQLTERGLGVAGVTGLVQEQTDALRGLLQMDVSARREGQAAVATARGSVAAFKEREFQVNELDPYLQERLRLEALEGAGLQNIMGGTQNIAEAGVNYSNTLGTGGGNTGLTNPGYR